MNLLDGVLLYCPSCPSVNEAWFISASIQIEQTAASLECLLLKNRDIIEEQKQSLQLAQILTNAFERHQLLVTDLQLAQVGADGKDIRT